MTKPEPDTRSRERRQLDERIAAEPPLPHSDLSTDTVGLPLEVQLQRLHLMDIRNSADVPAFMTLDGSEIRELLAHRNSSIRNQSLAEARLPSGASTTPHYHPKTEEIYYILEGAALMRIGEELRSVVPGDAIAIPPGLVHQITNTGDATLKFLCCCAPGYEHDDTVLVDETTLRHQR